MKDISPLQLMSRQALFILLGLAVIGFRIVPFEMHAGKMPWPDLFYCITMVYVIRRPEWVPVWAVFIVFFLRDILTLAPLGLGTMLMIFATEVVRTNVQAFREYFFGIEWMWIAGLFAGITVAQNIALGFVFADGPPLLDQLLLILLTGLAYPVIVGIMQFGFGMTQPQPGELDAKGKRL